MFVPRVTVIFPSARSPGLWKYFDPLKQWAAVSTWEESMRAPVHVPNELLIWTIHGYLPSSTFSPPAIRFKCSWKPLPSPQLHSRSTGKSISAAFFFTFWCSDFLCFWYPQLLVAEAPVESQYLKLENQLGLSNDASPEHCQAWRMISEQIWLLPKLVQHCQAFPSIDCHCCWLLTVLTVCLSVLKALISRTNALKNLPHATSIDININWIIALWKSVLLQCWLHEKYFTSILNAIRFYFCLFNSL